MAYAYGYKQYYVFFLTRIIPEINNYSYWRPCAALCRIPSHLTNDNFAQFPCIPCSYCLQLLYTYPHSTKWIIKYETIRYPLELSFPETLLTLHPNDPTKIAICSDCKSHSDGQLSRRLASIPACIENVPYAKRKYLSPIYLYTSLVCRSEFHLSNIEP